MDMKIWAKGQLGQEYLFGMSLSLAIAIFLPSPFFFLRMVSYFCEKEFRVERNYLCRGLASQILSRSSGLGTDQGVFAKTTASLRFPQVTSPRDRQMEDQRMERLSKESKKQRRANIFALRSQRETS